MFTNFNLSTFAFALMSLLTTSTFSMADNNDPINFDDLITPQTDDSNKAQNNSNNTKETSSAQDTDINVTSRSYGESHIIFIDPPAHSNPPHYHFKKIEPLYSNTNMTMSLQSTDIARQYKGFSLTTFTARNNEELKQIQELVTYARRQINQLNSLNINAGLYAFLKGFPITLSANPEGNGVYNPTTHAVELTIGGREMPQEAALLNGLMQAYYASLSSGSSQGLNYKITRMIKTHYAQAQTKLCTRPNTSALSLCYDPTAPMVQDEAQFFAATATTLLTDRSALEPFSGAKIKRLDPSYHEFLSRLLKGRGNNRLSAL